MSSTWAETAAEHRPGRIRPTRNGPYAAAVPELEEDSALLLTRPPPPHTTTTTAAASVQSTNTHRINERRKGPRKRRAKKQGGLGGGNSGDASSPLAATCTPGPRVEHAPADEIPPAPSYPTPHAHWGDDEVAPPPQRTPWRTVTEEGILHRTHLESTSRGWAPVISVQPEVQLWRPQETPPVVAAPAPAPEPVPAPAPRAKARKAKQKKEKKKYASARPAPTRDRTYTPGLRVEHAPVDGGHHSYTPTAPRRTPPSARWEDDEIVGLPQRAPSKILAEEGSTQAGILRRASAGSMSGRSAAVNSTPLEVQLRGPQETPLAQPAPAPPAPAERDGRLAATVRELERLQSVLARFQPAPDPPARQILAGRLVPRPLTAPPRPPPGRSHIYGGMTHVEWEAGFNLKVQLLKTTLDRLRPPAPRPQPPAAPSRDERPDWLDAELPIDDWLAWLDDGMAFDEWMRGFEEEQRGLDEQQVALDEWLGGSEERVRDFREREAAKARVSGGGLGRPGRFQSAQGIGARPGSVVEIRSQPPPTPAPAPPQTPPATASRVQKIADEFGVERWMSFVEHERLRVLKKRRAALARKSEQRGDLAGLHPTLAPAAPEPQAPSARAPAPSQAPPAAALSVLKVAGDECGLERRVSFAERPPRAPNELEAARARKSERAGDRRRLHQAPVPVVPRPQPPSAPAPALPQAPQATASSAQKVTGERKIERRVSVAEVLRVFNERQATTEWQSERAEDLGQLHPASAPAPRALPSQAAAPRPPPPPTPAPAPVPAPEPSESPLAMFWRAHRVTDELRMERLSLAERRAAPALQPERTDTRPSLRALRGTWAHPSPAAATRPQPFFAPAPVHAQTPSATASTVRAFNEELRMQPRMSLTGRLRSSNERHAEVTRDSERTENISLLHPAPPPRRAHPGPAAQPHTQPPPAPELYPHRYSNHPPPPPPAIPTPPARRLSISTSSTNPQGPGNGPSAVPAPPRRRHNSTPPVKGWKRPVAAVPPTPAPSSVVAPAQEAAALLQLCMDPDSKQDEHERQQLLELAADVLQRQLGKVTKKVEVKEEAKETRAVGDCVICLETTADTVLVPCGHLVLCTTCCRKMEIVGGEVPRRKEVPCPICRTAVKDRVKIFRA